ncbi:MAG TPA: recombination-associated protein RdgC [Candidatus Mailhella merdigallinarum]|uniref:Recombination-associated protein RdgC n=1 Tax=Candidatus Mailhella merdigallinarum TaxID=2838658 RepID=A0A9D2HCR2_9BACT|nr:recombination-associated protein RdgC [Candidatus Mailhella merdigallinarum]
MSFLKSSTSFTRFRLVDEVPADLWAAIPDKLKQFAFQDIDDIPQERSFGWVNFDDMLDTTWRLSPPEKADYITFSLRLDTRRIPPAVLKKHTRIAVQEEEARIREQGKKFVGRERKKELAEQVKLRLMSRFLPIPAEFQVVWATRSGRVYLASTQNKVIELFLDYFVRTFDLHLEQLLPYGLALSLLGDEASARLDGVESTKFL